MPTRGGFGGVSAGEPPGYISGAQGLGSRVQDLLSTLHYLLRTGSTKLAHRPTVSVAAFGEAGRDKQSLADLIYPDSITITATSLVLSPWLPNNSKMWASASL